MYNNVLIRKRKVISSCSVNTLLVIECFSLEFASAEAELNRYRTHLLLIDHSLRMYNSFENLLSIYSHSFMSLILIFLTETFNIFLREVICILKKKN